MRKLLIGVIVTFVLSFPVVRAAAGQSVYDPKAERKALKARQKQEWKMLEQQQKFQKRSWKSMRLSKVSRAQMKHQLQRDKRAMRESQRNDRQNLKDRELWIKQGSR